MWSAVVFRCSFLPLGKMQHNGTLDWDILTKVTPRETLLNSVSTSCRSKVEEENVEMWKGPATAARPVTLMWGDSSPKRSLSLKPLVYNSISDMHVIRTGRPVPAEILWRAWTSGDHREVKCWMQTLSPSFLSPCVYPPAGVKWSVSQTRTGNG